MAYLKQRGNKWFAVWRENGKKIVKATGVEVKGRREEKFAQATADAMEQAAKNPNMLAAALDAVRAAASLGGLNTTLPTIECFLNNYKPGGGKRNAYIYKMVFARFLDFLGAEKTKRLDSLTPSICSQFLSGLLNRVSYGTTMRYYLVLKAALATAQRDGIIDRNPFSSVSPSKIAPANMKRQSKRLPFTSKEMAIILTDFPPIWRDLSMLSFATGGQRLGDCCCLEWKNVDFANNIISFNTRKTNKSICAPIVPALRAMLESRYDANNTYIIPELAQKYIRSSSSICHKFRKLLQKHGICTENKPKLEGARRHVSSKSFHSIRHTVVSLLRSSNMFTADIAREIVGHNSEAVERQYFTASVDAKLHGLTYIVDTIQKSGEPSDSPLILPSAD